MQDRARIFAEFEQADVTATRRHGGAGLGLAIAERIVRGMGGSIALESEAGRGSSFAFALALPAVAEADPAAWPDLTGQACLVISDSPVLGPILRTRLAAWGATAALAPDAMTAGVVLKERTWDAVIVDRGIGLEAAMALGAAARPWAGRRIVLVTPAERGDLASLQQAGYDFYLVKPVRPASLAERLRPGLPTVAAPAIQPADALPGLVVPPEPAVRLSVLVAEDNDINAFLARVMLTKLGHRVQVVGDGEAAVAAVAEAHRAGVPFDLVLMDVQLPRLDGLEATRRIRALGEAGHVRIIALTANAFAEDRREAARRRHGRLPHQAARSRRADGGAGRGRRHPAPRRGHVTRPGISATGFHTGIGRKPYRRRWAIRPATPAVVTELSDTYVLTVALGCFSDRSP